MFSHIYSQIVFEDFEKSLKEIKTVSKKHVVLSLPHKAFNFRISGKLLPYVREKRLLIKIPLYRLLKHEFDGEHYWEIGKKNYPLKKIKEIETKTSEQEEPTVGDILKTVEKEKESEKEKEKTEVTEKETEVEDETENKVKIEKGIHVKGSLESDDDIVLKDKSTIDGDVISRKGNVTVGEDCTIKGKVKGIQVDISGESEIDEIDAEEDITLGKDVNVKKIRTDGDVELHKGVTVEEEIEYGEHLFFKGDGIKVGNLIHPIKSEEVVEEQWASQ